MTKEIIKIKGLGRISRIFVHPINLFSNGSSLDSLKSRSKIKVCEKNLRFLHLEVNWWSKLVV